MSGTTGTVMAAGEYNQNQGQWIQNIAVQLMQGGNIGGGPAAVGVYQNVVLHPAGGETYFAPRSIEYFRAIFRALRLLWKHLTPEQRGQYKLFCQGVDYEGRSFIVRGNATGDHYRIFEGGSVLRLRDQHRFCLVLIGEIVPPADMLLAKKLLLENDERLFLGTANDLSVPVFAQIIAEEYRDDHAAVRRALPPRAARRPPEPPTAPTTMGRRGRAFFNRIRQW